MESKKINQLATELSPALDDLTIIGDPTTGISRKITLSQMASLFTGTVEEYASLAAFPLVGAADTIYIALDTNILYRWNGSAYVELSPNIVSSLVFDDANGFDGTITLVGSVATLSRTTALTLGSLPFIGASGALSQDNTNLFYDDTNNRLGIGTNAPTTPLDVFGSGIISRINGTSTNNGFLGFSSAGTNKWSVGNVQSDHRFRIFSEANSAELVSLLQTGEFGIGIANPLTKLHIDGGATALIANLDANVSVAKSLSFRSDNSNRINLEVSGTESGSNVGADFFLRTFTDAGALIETPLSVVRSTGVTTIKSLTLTNALSVANGGTGSATQNFVDLTTTQTIGGAKTLTSALSGTSATFSSTVGIGTATSPAAELQVGKASDVVIAMSNSSSVTTGNRGGIAWYNSNTSTVANIRAVAVTDNVGTQLEFYTRPAAGSLTQVMTIASSGNVGIGTTSPAEKLDVRGNIYTNGTNTNLYLDNGGAGGAALKIGVIGTTETYISSLDSDPLWFGTSNTERMRITSGGNVLIGTTTDNGAKLQVSGAATFSGVVTTNGTSAFSGYGLTTKGTYGIYVQRGSVNDSGIEIYHDGSNAIFSTTYQSTGSFGGVLFYTSGLIRLTIASTGAVTIADLAGSGSRAVLADASGVLSAPVSDISVKQNIVPIGYGLNEIIKMNPVWFDFVDEYKNFGEGRQNGNIAQEIAEIIPEAVFTTKSTGKMGINYDQLHAVYIKAIQELKAEIDILKNN